jgi:5'-methylthioadenosine phosphorylase
MDIIGMTASPEVFLAREAEMCYTTMAHVTDYDVWHTSEEPVTVEMVIQTLYKNISIAQAVIHNMVKSIDPADHCGCEDGLKNALITHPDHVSPEKLKDLSLLVNKYLG